MLRIENVVKNFEHDPSPVINNISMQLKQGDFCVLIGSNGSGKSTLLKTLSGEYPLDSGSIWLNQNNLTTLSIHERAKYMSTLSQNMNQGTIVEMTLLENLILGHMRGSKASFKGVKHHHAILCEKVLELDSTLEGLLHKPLAALSGGQRQKIAILMATLSAPQLLLLDEHCSALDPKSQSMVMEFTAKAIKKGDITALMVTHDLADAINYGNRLIMLKKGQIAFDICEKAKRALSISELRELFYD